MSSDDDEIKLVDDVVEKKPCPFCGGFAYSFFSTQTYAYHVTCGGEINDECRGIDSGGCDKTGYISRQAAIDAWDKRA